METKRENNNLSQLCLFNSKSFNHEIFLIFAIHVTTYFFSFYLDLLQEYAIIPDSRPSKILQLAIINKNLIEQY